MRSSDWSSDVCSSDLIAIDAAVLRASGGEGAGAQPQIIEGVAEETARAAPRSAAADPAPDKPSDKPSGQASDQASKKASGPQSSAAAPPRRSRTFMPGLVLGDRKSTRLNSRH